MTGVQFWLIIAAIYDVGIRIKTPKYQAKWFIYPITFCLLSAFYCSEIVQEYLKGLFGL